jgi:hypothetical protein
MIFIDCADCANLIADQQRLKLILLVVQILKQLIIKNPFNPLTASAESKKSF